MRPARQVRGRHAGAGFTGVELLFVLAIVAILATLAAPSFRDMLRKQRLITVANDLFASVNLARAEAIGRNRRVDLVPTDGENWRNGWAVIVDLNGDQLLSAGEPVIMTHGPMPDGITISSTFPAAAPPYLAFNASGRTRSNGSAQATRPGSWTLILGKMNRKVVVNFLGRARVCDPAADPNC